MLNQRVCFATFVFWKERCSNKASVQPPPPKCVRQSPAAPGVPVVFCGTPRLSWQPSRSLPKDDRPQRSQSMMHAVLDAAAAAGTVSPEDEEGCHTKIFLYVRSVYHWSGSLASWPSNMLWATIRPCSLHLTLPSFRKTLEKWQIWTWQH